MKKRKPRRAPTQNNNVTVKLSGCRVRVDGDSDRDFDRAMKIFNRKVADNGILQDLRKHEFHETSGQARRRKKSLARNRWLREQKMGQTQKDLIDQF